MIAIKGMDIPIRCENCKFCINQRTNDYGSWGECLLQKNKRVNCLVWRRDDDCPLISIRDDTEMQILREDVADMKSNKKE